MTQKAKTQPIFTQMETITESVKQIVTVSEIDLAEFIRLVESFQIITKTEGRRSLIFNKDQERVWHIILDHRERGLLGRFICCKSRRLGISTLIEAICCADVILRPSRYAQVVAQDWLNADYLFNMTKLFYRYLPKDWRKKRPLLSDTKRSLVFKSPHDSRISVSTANNKALASSQLIHMLHLSEVSKYKDPPAADALTSIQQCVPDVPENLIFWESTAFGAHNLFHDTWLAAKAKENNMEPIFLTWRGFPEYFVAPLQGWKADWSHEEKEYKDKYDISDGEMLWVRQAKAKCHNSWPEFHQEYPIEDHLAFKWSGHPWFDRNAMERLKTGEEKPKTIGTLRFVSDTDPIVEFREAA